MRPAATGAVSGCVVWLVLFAVLGMCFVPLALVVGGITSTSPFAMGRVAPLICPKGTAATVYSYATTSTDENGFPINSTAYELHCVDEAGEIVKNDPVAYALLWQAMCAALAILVVAVLTFALAAPAGILLGRLVRPRPGRRG